MARTVVPPPPELDWLKLREEMEDGMIQETFSQRFVRKVKEQPLVPVGCMATVAALTYGLYSFKKGDSRMSQYMMRSRVIAQGFTIVVAVIGTMLASNRSDLVRKT